MSMHDIAQLEQKIGITFQDKQGLIQEALTHRSKSRCNSERLEFLGDAVLCMVISQKLYEAFPVEKEGNLAKRRESLVNGNTIAQVANNIGLAEYIIMEHGEEITGGRYKPKILEDILESVIGAIYLEHGLETVQKFILKFWKEFILQYELPPKDPKSELQELLQSRTNKVIPNYELILQEGEAHQPIFTVKLTVNGYNSVLVKNTTKKKS